MKLSPRLVLLIVCAISLLASAPLARACADCGGSPLKKREAEPRASTLHPDAPVVEYTLDVTETTLSPAGRPVRGLVINGASPGPVLRFREGEIARIHVRNHLAREETSTHWHGLLVPNLEDGVPHLTTPPIRPGESRTFEFLLKHAGTYWYHSHTGLQEQRGLYGAIVVEPRPGTPPRADLPPVDREEVVVLSDWTDESPAEVMRTLLRGSDWYALRKGTAQSVLGALRAGRLDDFVKRERARLPAMDVSDVAYDAFLINGRASQHQPARPGETIRLRVINAAASTYFYVGSATGPLRIVAADGMDVVPILQNRLLVGMAETYDVLVTIPADAAPEAAWEIRATAQDDSGHASLLLGGVAATGASASVSTSSLHVGPVAFHSAPAPGPLDLYSMDAAMDAILAELDATGDITDAEALAAEPARPLPPYARLRSPTPTTLPAAAPVRELTLKLTGDMTRYLWSLDDQPVDRRSTIPVKRGEILRLTLVNNTMMHHPMHLHGHFFRLLMPDGAPVDHAPFKHTVDIPPMSRRVIEFYADEDRDWLFHCHLLYHMMAGMARVVSYDDQGPDHRPDLGEHGMSHPAAWIEGTVQTHLADGLATVQRGRENLHLAWTVGWERVARREYEIDATYAHYFSPRWTAFAGYRLTNRPGGADSVLVGATHTLPYLVDLTVSLQSDGHARAGLAKTIPLTSRLGLVLDTDHDTAQDFGWSAALTYTLTKQLSFIAGHDSDYGPGAGVAYRF